MASEELQQKYPDNIGAKIGSYEVFECQLATLNQFAQHGILPQIDYGKWKTQKCDALVIQREPALSAIVIGEHKAPGSLTPANIEAFAADLLESKCHPTKALLGYLEDGVTCVWINGRADRVVKVTREDDKPMPLHVDYKDKAFVSELEYIINNFDPAVSQVVAPQNSNPAKLAETVWQTIWRLKADRPEDCLATFVELFLFKFLSDLGLLKKNTEGVEVSFEHLLSLDASTSYSYYEKHVRDYIKHLFPSGDDGYSIINGIVLQGTNRDHNIIFSELLKKFNRFGSLKHTAPEFKTRLYESFLKESKTTSTFGQFFTPRKVVTAIHDMANVNSLASGRVIADPACGVGGFILEQMARDLHGQWTLVGNKMSPLHTWHGFELVPKTAILAKANALVHCGELLANQPSRIKSFSKWLNNTFVCKDRTALGSLEEMPVDKFDLILTNPPFVVSGSADIGKLIRSNNKRKRYFGRKYSGVEGLFIQYIVQSLKKNGDAWLLLPETFFLRTTDDRLRLWLLRCCSLDLLAILPERTFFNTPKRVVITHIKKRVRELSDAELSVQAKKEKVLLFAVGEIGETRDARRLPTTTDLPLLVETYRAFKAGSEPSTSVKRAAVATCESLVSGRSINLRHFWSKGVAQELELLSGTEDPVKAKLALDTKMTSILEVAQKWLKTSSQLTIPPAPAQWRTLQLGDTKIFKLRIGRRVLKKSIYQKRSGVPLFSANIRKTFGFVDTANAGSLTNGGCLWSIDSDFDCRGVSPGERYSITDHCGQLEILTDQISPEYLARQIRQAGADQGFNRDYRPSLEVMQTVEVDLPAREDGSFDLDVMNEWAKYFELVDDASTRI